MNKHKEFGRHLAELFYGTGIKKLPFVLGREQAEGFIERWKELDKENKNYESKRISEVINEYSRT